MFLMWKQKHDLGLDKRDSHWGGDFGAESAVVDRLLIFCAVYGGMPRSGFDAACWDQVSAVMTAPRRLQALSDASHSRVCDLLFFQRSLWPMFQILIQIRSFDFY